jgi:hypothetical protein
MKRITADVLPLPTLTPQDVQNFVEWVTSIDNSFDKDVMFYPRTVMLRALSDGVPIVYVPLQPVLMYESLAPRPDLSNLQRAVSLREISATVDAMATHTGHGEGYFMTNSKEEMELVTKRGWKVCLYDPERRTWLLKRKFKK